MVSVSPRPAFACALAAFALVFLAACDSSPTRVDIPPSPRAAEDRPGGLGVLDSVRYVVHVSIDGLRPDAVEVLGSDGAPALSRLRREAAYTHNARTDPDVRNTMPNHVAQLTGRLTSGLEGHGWTDNEAVEGNVHGNKGAYVPSVFDVVHDAGRPTAAYVSKEKFALLTRSYNDHGARDETGADDGRAKIDVYYHHHDTDGLVSRIERDFRAAPPAYAFVHVRDPDFAGHEHGWDLSPGSPYLAAVERADDHVRSIIDLVEADRRLRGRTVVLVTSDHGGSGREHGSAHIDHFTVPFYVWGPGIRPGDLYALNPHLEDPGADQGAAPVRNGDAANVVTRLLGLEAVPTSTIGSGRALEVAR